ncbi:DUF805 domain-containing protein [Asticcacaulis taihuensis]|uniref:Uncharacterized membrane protein YhaH, DUF805 family n=1 Tax=Asticcacaulis taihuensis TaxID=260084 RepID=A0A1G4QER7_9CAUL|nr:DUF805 domain-containing protein [Asticcacaulis taihuensis]SCW43094.1 Uncharacterized membrane protein YhaH, DUF805 family [Asticcacaulis taihuensis]
MAKHHILVGANAMFSPRGRINRLQFVLNFWACQVLIFVIWFGIAILPDALSDEWAARLDQPLNWLTMVLTVLLYFALFCLCATRLHDVGLSAWLGLILFAGFIPGLISSIGSDAIEAAGLTDMVNFIAFLGNLAVLILGIALSVWPGQPEENIYGPSPDQT